MPCTLPVGEVAGRFRSPWASIQSAAPGAARLGHAAERAHRDRVVAAEHERDVPAVGRVARPDGDLLADAHDRREVAARRVRPPRSSPAPASRRRPSRRPRARARADARSARRSGSPTGPCRRRAAPGRGRALRRSPRQACAMGSSRCSTACSRRGRLLPARLEAALGLGGGVERDAERRELRARDQVVELVGETVQARRAATPTRGGEPTSA